MNREGVTRRKRALFWLVLLTLPWAVAEGSIELMLRVPSYLPDAVLRMLREYYYAEDQRYIQYVPECAKYDARLTYVLRPGRCRFSGREFDTSVAVNSLGVRDDESSLRAPAIIVLGDSIAMGWGVEQHETFADLLERRTGKRVLNLSVSSYGTVRELEILKRADTSQLKYLIVQYSPNDLEENRTFMEHGNHLPISSKEEYLHTRAAHLRRTRYYCGKHVVWLFKAAFAALHQEDETSDVHEADYFLNALAQASISEHVQIILLGAPGEKRSGRRERRERMIHVEYPEDRGSWYALDRHLTAKGHQVIAQRLLQVVEFAAD